MFFVSQGDKGEMVLPATRLHRTHLSLLVLFQTKSDHLTWKKANGGRRAGRRARWRTWLAEQKNPT